MTAQRWLELPPGSALELECGEDIDHVTDAVAAAYVAKRVLEQVKVSEKSVTLRSPASVEAFANFVEHCRLNLGVSLRVRITTTAARGKERPEIFEKRQGMPFGKIRRRPAIIKR